MWISEKWGDQPPPPLLLMLLASHLSHSKFCVIIVYIFHGVITFMIKPKHTKYSVSNWYKEKLKKCLVLKRRVTNLVCSYKVIQNQEEKNCIIQKTLPVWFYVNPNTCSKHSAEFISAIFNWFNSSEATIRYLKLSQIRKYLRAFGHEDYLPVRD